MQHGRKSVCIFMHTHTHTHTWVFSARTAFPGYIRLGRGGNGWVVRYLRTGGNSSHVVCTSSLCRTLAASSHCFETRPQTNHTPVWGRTMSKHRGPCRLLGQLFDTQAKHSRKRPTANTLHVPSLRALNVSLRATLKRPTMKITMLGDGVGVENTLGHSTRGNSIGRLFRGRGVQVWQCAENVSLLSRFNLGEFEYTKRNIYNFYQTCSKNTKKWVQN